MENAILVKCKIFAKSFENFNSFKTQLILHAWGCRQLFLEKNQFLHITSFSYAGKNFDKISNIQTEVSVFYQPHTLRDICVRRPTGDSAVCWLSIGTGRIGKNKKGGPLSKHEHFYFNNFPF